jgi:hypothetical protein
MAIQFGRPIGWRDFEKAPRSRRHAPTPSMQEREEVRKLRVLRLRQQAEKYRCVIATVGKANGG